MQIVIDIPDGCYNELCNAQFPAQDTYRLVEWIKNGTPLPKDHGFIAICDSDEELSEQTIQELKNTVFVGDEKCSYCFDIVDIIEADTSGKEQK